MHEHLARARKGGTDHTLPYGTESVLAPFPGTTCQATFIQSTGQVRQLLKGRGACSALPKVGPAAIRKNLAFFCRTFSCSANFITFASDQREGRMLGREGQWYDWVVAGRDMERRLSRLVERARIDDGVARKKDGKLGRNFSRLSFRSLRHSFNSAMANADVPLEIRQKLTGHASQDMNKHYTHLELETVRRAVESISRLPNKASDIPPKESASGRLA